MNVNINFIPKNLNPPGNKYFCLCELSRSLSTTLLFFSLSFLTTV